MRLHVIGLQQMIFPGNKDEATEYDVIYTSPIGDFKNEKIQIHGVGHKVPTDRNGRPETFKCAAHLVSAFEKLGLPAWVDVELAGQLNAFGKVVSYVVSVKPASPVIAKAA